MKYIFFILFLLTACASPQKSFYKKHHPHETRKSYNEKRGLMLLDNTMLGRNKHFNDKSYQNRLKKAYRKYHKHE